MKEEGPLFDPGVQDAKPTGMLHPVIAVLDDMQEMVEKKAQDYAQPENVFSNFEFVAEAAGIEVGQVFMVMMATKVARLRELGGRTTEPNFESVEDTLMDLANYAALSAAYMRHHA